MKKTPDYTKYKLRTCRTLHYCNICGEHIRDGQKYYDGGYDKRAHEKCVKSIKDKKNESHM